MQKPLVFHAGQSTTIARLSISEATWRRLLEANEVGVQAGWADRGVFATGVGPDYQRGMAGSLLYVGKSAGPLGQAVGLCDDQAESSRASTEWMIERKNKRSNFWHFVNRIDPTRRRIAWSNVCKMDRIGGQRPPTDANWAEVAEPCVAALAEEIDALAPQVIVFATSGAYQADVRRMLASLKYEPISLPFEDGWTTCSKTSDGKFVIETKHPQGWDSASRNRVIDLTMELLAAPYLSEKAFEQSGAGLLSSTDHGQRRQRPTY